MPMSQKSHSGRVLARTHERSPLPTPSASRPPAISRDALSHSAHVPVRHVPDSFQRKTDFAADAFTRSVNITTAFCTLSGRSVVLVGIDAFAVAAIAVSIIAPFDRCVGLQFLREG